ncbi:MAG: hypothetical protein K6E47_04355 [Lachnospiraceae bacterium]|nr:hypothetical protein [Lachnospiraceae bacterium]
MAINIKTVTCPACGAKVNYDENNKTAYCEFCGALLDMTEEYGEKKDRERDDIQDMKINHILNNINGRPVRTNNVDIQKSRKTALIIILAIFGTFFIISIMFSVVGGRMAFNTINSIATSTKEEETEVEIDPFDKLTITYSGISGKGTARLSDGNVYSVSNIKKTTSNTDKLSNGDTITVKYETNSVKYNRTIYNLTQTEKTYTVYGLDEYVFDINEVGEEDLEILKKNAIQKALNDCKEVDFAYVEDSFNIYAIYTLVEKDYSEQMSVFIVSFDYIDEDETKTGYHMSKYSNIVKHSNGEYKINFNTGTYTYVRESYFNGFTVPSAHSTWDAVYTDVYLNNKADWFIHEDLKN